MDGRSPSAAEQAGELVTRALLLQQAGKLDGETLKAVNADISRLIKEIRAGTSAVVITGLGYEAREPWQDYGVSKNFYHSLTPEQWSVFEYIFHHGGNQFVSEVEIAEEVFGEASKENLRRVSRAETALLSRGEKENHQLEMQSILFRGEMTLGYRWALKPNRNKPTR
jgi:hypothetical protein